MLLHAYEFASLGWIFFLQAVPLSARKATGGNPEGIAPFLQLPHFSETILKKIARKVIRYVNNMMNSYHILFLAKENFITCCSIEARGLTLLSSVITGLIVEWLCK